MPCGPRRTSIRATSSRSPIATPERERPHGEQRERGVFVSQTLAAELGWKLGDRVVFELLDDSISGPRGQNVRLAPARKAR